MRVDANGGIYVADYGHGGILYFAPGVSGNVAPTFQVPGSSIGPNIGANSVQFIGAALGVQKGRSGQDVRRRQRYFTPQSSYCLAA